MPAWKVVEIQLKTAIISFFCSFSFCPWVFSLLFVNHFLSWLPVTVLNKAGSHLSAAQAHERDDLEEEGAVAIKAASCLCCSDKIWTSSIHPGHFINNQNPSTEESSASNTFLGCLARCLWGEHGRILRRWASKAYPDYFISGRGQGRLLEGWPLKRK